MSKARLRSFLSRHTDALVVTFVFMAVLGAVLLLLSYTLLQGRGAGLLQVLGGGVLAAGLSGLVSTVSGKAAIRQQYAKEAHLQRKRDIYGPLYTELKAVLRRLEDVEKGKAPCPQQINTDPDQIISSTPLRDVMPLRWWSVFRQDYRRDDFTDSAQAVLDELIMAAGSYNEALQAAEFPTLRILGKHIESAVKTLRHSSEYEKWLKHSRLSAGEPGMVGHEPKPEYRWFKSLEATTATADLYHRSVGEELAGYWLTWWPHPQRSRALGWLLAKRPEDSAAYVRWGYQSGLSDSEPRQGWIEDTFDEAWPALRDHPAYCAVSEAQTVLLQRVRTAERMLADGMRIIRDEFEGGTPLV